MNCVDRQIEVIERAVSSYSERSRFLSAPDTYARELGVDLDTSLRDAVIHEMLNLEPELEKLVSSNPFLPKISGNEVPGLRLPPNYSERIDDVPGAYVAAAGALAAVVVAGIVASVLL
jgi:hypothetical protein